jgi:hypothetical protein
MGRTCGTKEGEEECIQNFGWESQKERDHYEDLNVGGRIILKWILREIGWGSMELE